MWTISSANTMLNIEIRPLHLSKELGKIFYSVTLVCHHDGKRYAIGSTHNFSATYTMAATLSFTE